jgi:hypothetical protein
MNLTGIWIAALLLIFTFVVLDASALAASASLAALRPLLTGILAFFVLLAGGVLTAWKMKSH